MTAFFEMSVPIVFPAMMAVLILFVPSFKVTRNVIRAVAGLLILAYSIGVYGFFNAGSSVQSEMFGWYGIGDGGFISLGLLFDQPVFVVVTLFYVLSLIFLTLISRTQTNNLRINLVAALVSLSGLSVSWAGVNLWMTVFGIIACSVGVVLMLSSEKQSSSEFITRLFWENSVGIVLILLGASILGLQQPDRRWDTEVYFGSGDLILGMVSILIGVLVLFRSFPMIQWVIRGDQLLTPIRVYSLSVVMAWAVSGLLFRISGDLRFLGVFPQFGYYALFLGTLGLVVALFREKWFHILLLWGSSSCLFFIAVLDFAGIWSAMGILVGSSLGAFALSIFGQATQIKNAGDSEKSVGIFNRIILFLCGFLCVGGTGFVSSGAIFNVFRIYSDSLLFWSLATLVTYLWMTVLWKSAFLLLKNTRGSLDGITLLLVLILLGLGTGVLWTGSLSGGGLVGLDDRLAGWMDILALFNEYSNVDPRMGLFSSKIEDGLRPVYSLFGILSVSFISGYWMTRRNEVKENKGVSRIFTHGFYLEEGLERLSALLLTGITHWESVFTDETLDRLVTNWVRNPLSQISTNLSRFDQLGSLMIKGGFLQGVNGGARVIQWVQNGNSQWYVFLGVFSAGALIMISAILGSGR